LQKSASVALFLLKYEKRRRGRMKTNGYATNKGGFIKAPKPVAKDSPKSTVIAKGGKDLRAGKN
jgi:hypothetical protein